MPSFHISLLEWASYVVCAALAETFVLKFALQVERKASPDHA
jgi:hypothetical protein